MGGAGGKRSKPHTVAPRPLLLKRRIVQSCKCHHKKILQDTHYHPLPPIIHRDLRAVSFVCLAILFGGLVLPLLSTQPYDGYSASSVWFRMLRTGHNTYLQTVSVLSLSSSSSVLKSIGIPTRCFQSASAIVRPGAECTVGATPPC